MTSVKLKPNPDKADFIIIAIKDTRESLIPKFPSYFRIDIPSMVAEEVKKLGITLHS